MVARQVNLGVAYIMGMKGGQGQKQALKLCSCISWLLFLYAYTWLCFPSLKEILERNSL